VLRPDARLRVRRARRADLILGGDTTPAAERRICEVLAATIPLARYETFPGIGHMGILVRPVEVNARIARHIRDARRDIPVASG
jgi:pimeloyl-ACP methyl ester carboxylesterase